MLVDTSVWSLAFRRDQPPDMPEVAHLRRELVEGGDVVTTGIVVQEVLQGINGPKQRAALVERLAVLPTIAPDRRDHVEAAEIHGACRRGGVQIATVDALLISLARRYDLPLLTTDRDFVHASRVVPVPLWAAPNA